MVLHETDILIIGAGVAGLAALRQLDRAGLNVLCVEARDRIGGRIYTLRDPFSPLPIELGAEFVHGRPPETWEIIQAAALGGYDCGEHAVHIENGRVNAREDAWLLVDDVMQDMQKAAQVRDISFADFLAGTAHPREASYLATSYVEGFNAARADVIGIQSLAQDAAAGEAIEGDKSFRIVNGYDAVPAYLAGQLSNAGRRIHLNSVVERVTWAPQQISTFVRSNVSGQQTEVRSRRVVVTVPLGVLQAAGGEGVIRFDPEPAAILEAAHQLRFGDVYRTIFRFRDCLLEQNPELADTGFLLSGEAVFPTWWTALPFRTPMITGWSAGRKAEPLVGKTRQQIAAQALERLAKITGVPLASWQESLAGFYFHDWQADPYSRGAYSYTPVGALQARTVLAQPVEDTLFFAGEATETEGHSATVHGAIATGLRVARQVLASL